MYVSAVAALTTTPVQDHKILMGTQKQSKKIFSQELGSCVENGVNNSSNGLKAIVGWLLKTGSNEILEFLHEAKNSRPEDQTTLGDMKTILSNNRKIEKITEK